MKHRPTPEQQAAIDAPLGEILVSASAGTGKTRVMTERLIQRIVAGEIDVREVLVLTFTEAASHEMKRRISLLLDEAIEAHPDQRSRLLAQRRRLQQAQISTLHAFCLRVIRDFHHLLEDEREPLVEAGFHTLSADLASETLEFALEQVMADAYRTISEEESFGTATREGLWLLNDTLGTARNDNPLRETLISTFYKLQAYPDFDALVMNARAEAEAIAEDFWTPTSLRWITEELRPEVEVARWAISELIEMLPSIQFYIYDPTKNTKRVQENKGKDEETKAEIRAVIAASQEIIVNYDRLVGIAEGTVTFIPEIDRWDAWRDRVDQAISAQRGLRRISVKKDDPARSAFVRLFNFTLRRLIERFTRSTKGRVILFRRPQAEIQAELKTMLPAIESFAQLLLNLKDRYQAEKKRLGGIDFADFEHYALRILRQEEATRFYRQRYKEIYVDEYQDTSEIQEAILQNLGTDLTFRVGDVKQSIYRFRAAEPRLFLDRLQSYQQHEGGELYSLSMNFRSEPGILTWINELFAILMQADVTEIEYKGLHEFTAGREANEEGPRMDLTLLMSEHGSEATRPEQDEIFDQQVVEDILKLLREGIPSGDICIMARNHASLQRFARRLQTASIPYSYGTESAPDELPIQQRRLETLIQVLDNPRQDQPLAAVLMSSFVPVPFLETELLELRLVDKSKNLKFHEIILDFDFKASDLPTTLQEKLRLFRLWLYDLRRPLGAGALQERYTEIFEQTDFYAVCALSGDPREQQLPEQFLAYLESHTELGDFHSLAKRLQGGAKALELSIPQSSDLHLIQLMTFHGSKGLEFPYIFLLDFQRTLFSGGTDDPLNYDRDLGFTINYRDPDRPFQRKNIFDRLLKAKLRRLDLAEEVRLLYVALTRAEKKISAYARVNANTIAKNYEVRRNQSEDILHTHLSPKAYEDFLRQHDIREAGSDLELLLLGLDLESMENLIALPEDATFRPISKHINARMLALVVPGELPLELTQSIPEETTISSEPSDGVLLAPRPVLSPPSPVIEDIKQKRYFLNHTEGEVDPYYAALYQEGARAKDQEMLELKYSVSELLRRPEERLESEERIVWQAINRQQSSLKELHLENEPEGKLKGAERGSAIHEVIRYLDWVALRSAFDAGEGVAAFEEQLQQMLDAQMIEPIIKETAAPLGDQMMKLVSSDIGAKLATYPCLQEQPFTLTVPAHELYPDLVGDVQVQGVLDLAWFEEDAAGLLDFKTDNIKGDHESVLAVLKERYSRQMDYYQRAIEMSGLTQRVSERFIFLIDRGELFEL